MKRYKVQMTDRAAADMEEIYRYIADTLLAHDTAMRQYDRIATEILTLEQLPERCPALGYQPAPGVTLRRLLVDNYSVIYLVEDDRVVVQRVLYSASDIIARLQESHY